eukprot:scaffold429829_cov49-Prasinocladus_malaysianus.AAC.2
MASGVAEAVEPTDKTPDEIKEVLEKAGERWLKTTEVSDILENYKKYDFKVSLVPPNQPPGSNVAYQVSSSSSMWSAFMHVGGAVFLFDRKQVRFFRKDGHNWRKKPDGKTVRETHEKLKVDNQDLLNCYYAHAEDQDDNFQLQRRCYWLLEGDGNMVLVHYLNIPAESLRSALAKRFLSLSVQFVVSRLKQCCAPFFRPRNEREDMTPLGGLNHHHQ